MKSKHTRGPWTVGRDESGEIVVESPDGILCMPYFWVWPECSDPLPGDPEANARLMAASPELLDVACQLAEWGRGGMTISELGGVIHDAVAAIDKATQEEA